MNEKDFCRACGSLAALGICPKGHDSTLNDKIKDVIRSEDGTRVLVSNDGESLGKEFWSYACEHRKKVYVLKSLNKKPEYFLRILSATNPCEKYRGYDLETYKLQEILEAGTVAETDAERSLKQAELNMLNWQYRLSKTSKN